MRKVSAPEEDLFFGGFGEEAVKGIAEFLGYSETEEEPVVFL